MYSSVLVTFPDLEAARKVSRQLVNKKLAACANMIPIESIYRWKGKVFEEGECAVIYKIQTLDFELVKQEVLSLHPYETPCIVRYDIAEGHLPYLDWITESTNRHP